jgi:hypothetical protein
MGDPGSYVDRLARTDAKRQLEKRSELSPRTDRFAAVGDHYVTRPHIVWHTKPVTYFTAIIE